MKYLFVFLASLAGCTTGNVAPEVWGNVRILDSLPKDASTFKRLGALTCKERPRWGKPDGYCNDALKRDAASIKADFLVIENIDVKDGFYTAKKAFTASAYKYLTAPPKASE